MILSLFLKMKSAKDLDFWTKKCQTVMAYNFLTRGQIFNLQKSKLVRISSSIHWNHLDPCSGSAKIAWIQICILKSGSSALPKFLFSFRGPQMTCCFPHFNFFLSVTNGSVLTPPLYPPMWQNKQTNTNKQTQFF